MANFYNNLITEGKWGEIFSTVRKNLPTDKKAWGDLASSVKSKIPSNEETANFIRNHHNRIIGGTAGLGGLFAYDHYNMEKRKNDLASTNVNPTSTPTSSSVPTSNSVPVSSEESKGVFQRGIDKIKDYGASGLEYMKNNPGTTAAIGAATAAGLGALALRKKLASRKNN